MKKRIMALIGAGILAISSFFNVQLLKKNKALDKEIENSISQIQYLEEENNALKDRVSDLLELEKEKVELEGENKDLVLNNNKLKKIISETNIKMQTLNDLLTKINNGTIDKNVAESYLKLLDYYEYIGEEFSSSNGERFVIVGKLIDKIVYYEICNVQTGELSKGKYTDISIGNDKNNVDLVVVKKYGPNNECCQVCG